MSGIDLFDETAGQRELDRQPHRQIESLRPRDNVADNALWVLLARVFEVAPLRPMIVHAQNGVKEAQPPKRPLDIGRQNGIMGHVAATEEEEVEADIERPNGQPLQNEATERLKKRQRKGGGRK